jgi:hypothetical protein
MATAVPPSRFRKLAAFLSLLVSAGIVAKAGIHSWRIEWLIVAFAGILAVAAAGLTRKSLVVQVLSRGAAWVVLAPSLLYVLFQLLGRGSFRFDLEHLLAVSSAAALLLAQPMLKTAEARKSFDPKVFRGWFLAGSTASVSVAYLAGGIALEAIDHRAGSTIVGFGALAGALLASAIGVIRMRGWGILLGALTSAALVVSSFAIRGDSELSFGLLLFAVPTLLLHLAPILLARLGLGKPAAPATVRIDEGVTALDAPRIRIAEDQDAELETFPDPAPARREPLARSVAPAR